MEPNSLVPVDHSLVNDIAVALHAVVLARRLAGEGAHERVEPVLGVAEHRIRALADRVHAAQEHAEVIS